MDNQSTKKAAEAFANAFAAALASSLIRSIGSGNVQVTDDSDVSASRGKPVHFRLQVTGNLRGQCFVELYEPDVADLGGKILGHPAKEFADEHAEALSKVISSAMPELKASLSADHGKVTVSVEGVADLAFGGMLMVPLSVVTGTDAAVPALLYFDGQLLNALSYAPAAGAGTEAGRLSVDPSNLKLVMDVELNISLRFGQRQLPLREVLELANGSVIELDRQVDDPIELLLNGKVIARGEAVIVDGNYGVRVTEVPLPIAYHLEC
jgi:flagellar motor switch protein FliN/FliY